MRDRWVSRTKEAVKFLKSGGILLYPAEGVYGLGCDPHCESALIRLRVLKARLARQGFLLVAADSQQAAPYIHGPGLSSKQWIEVGASSTPEFPVSWRFPAQPGLSTALLGTEPHTVVIRLSTFPPLRRLCLAFGGALVSTSANLRGEAPLRSPEAVRAFLIDFPELVWWDRPLGAASCPSEIRDWPSGAVLRPACPSST